MRVELILREIQEKKQSKQEYVSSGRCKDFVEYRCMCSEIHSLETIEALIIDSRDKEGNEDE